MNTYETIANHVARLRQDKGLAEMAAQPGMVMGEGGLGLDSLDLATLVALLERDLGCDPFAERIPPFNTFGEFAALYGEGA